MYWHKARLQDRFILEIEIFKIKKSKNYPDGLKYGLILIDVHSGRKILMDNHHPKGHHIHIDEREIAYLFLNEDQLIHDFKTLVFENMGVKL